MPPWGPSSAVHLGIQVTTLDHVALRFDPLSLWERVRVRAASRATGRAFGTGDALTPALSQRERDSDRGPE